MIASGGHAVVRLRFIPPSIHQGSRPDTRAELLTMQRQMRRCRIRFHHAGWACCFAAKQ